MSGATGAGGVNPPAGSPAQQRSPQAGDGTNTTQQHPQTTGTSPQAGSPADTGGVETMTPEVAREIRRENQALRQRGNDLEQQLRTLQAQMQQAQQHPSSQQSNSNGAGDSPALAALTQQFGQLQQQLQQQQAAAREALAMQQFTAAATAAGCVNPTLLARMLDRTQITYDQTGQPLNIHQLLAEFRRDAPMMFRVAGAGQADAGAGNARPGAPTSPNADINAAIRNKWRGI